jgi:hypothetical protein
MIFLLGGVQGDVKGCGGRCLDQCAMFARKAFGGDFCGMR